MSQPSEANSKMMDKADHFQIGERLAAITDISVSGNYATDDTPIETAINSIIAVLEQHGLIAD